MPIENRCHRTFFARNFLLSLHFSWAKVDGGNVPDIVLINQLQSSTIAMPGRMPESVELATLE
jgi:hypothetical protein